MSTTVYAELPLFIVDEIVLDDLGLGTGVDYIEVIDRFPEPNETNVLNDVLISFNAACSAGSPVTIGKTVIQIRVTSANGTVGPWVTAYAAGSFQPGFNGPDSAVTSLDSSTTRFVIDSTLDYDSESKIDVQFITESATVNQKIFDWFFTIEDLTAPQLLSATPRSDKVVRLVFNEDVEQGSVSTSDSALNPSNYIFTRSSETLPSVNIEANSVEVVTSYEIDITLDIEMTPGAIYDVVVENVEDIYDNVIQAPYNTAQFTGFIPNISENRNFNLYYMLSRKNRDEDNGDLLKFISCLQEVTNLILVKIDEWTDIIDPDKASESFLDAMLQDLGNPFAFDLTLNEKRKLIRILVEIYKQKGTEPGIINVIRFFLGIEVEINSLNDEGWDLGVDELGDAVVEGTAILGSGTSYNIYSFEIVSPVALTEEQREQITDIANYMKPAHTHLINIIEPEIPVIVDHIELGLSILGDGEWWLH
jgi:phage tail-like protein